MKPWIKRTLFGLFASVFAIGGLAACSHRGPGGWGEGGWHHGATEAERTQARERMVERVASKLDLDATQRAKLDTLAKTLQQQRQAMTGGTDMRAEVKSLVAGPAFDRTKASALVQAKTQAVQTGSPAVIDALGDFYDSLRPEQQQQVRDFMERGRRGWRH